MKPGLIALATLALLAATACDSRSDLRPLTVVGWGGSSQDAHRQAYWNGFTQSTGIALREDSWRGGVGVIRTKVIGGAASWAVVQVETEDLILGCEEGLFRRLDWASRGCSCPFLPPAVLVCAAGALL